MTLSLNMVFGFDILRDGYLRFRDSMFDPYPYLVLSSLPSENALLLACGYKIFLGRLDFLEV